MPVPTPELTPGQQAVAAHRGGPAVVLAGAGTGGTTALVARFAALVEEGLAPEALLVVAPGAAAAEQLRALIEAALGDRPFEELAVLTPSGLAARVLRDEALEAGLDPFVVPAGAADRLAMLLEHVDELTLSVHDLGGNPAAVLARVVARIDRLKAELVSVDEHLAWAAELGDGDPRAAREREFGLLWAAHDRLLDDAGLLDAGELVVRAVELLAMRPHVRARVGARWREVLADDVQDLSLAERRLLQLVASEGGRLCSVGDPDRGIVRARGGGTANLRAMLAAEADVAVLPLAGSLRSPSRIVATSEAVLAPLHPLDRLAQVDEAPPGGTVRFWRAATERAQAQGVAAEVERLLRAGTPPDRIGLLVRSVRTEGQALSVALEERAVPHRVLGAAAFFQRAEVRDVLAWLRLLVDPGDAAAVVRALARPPVELRSPDLARCVQIARRRKLDVVSALSAALESPQVTPEARERIRGFLKLHRAAVGALDTTRPDLFVHRLIDRLGLRRQQLFAAQADVVERLRHLARLGELAAQYTRRAPQATPREFARYLSAVADAGLREEEEGEAGRHAGAVAVLALHQARGRDFDHVFVCGLQASRMPGARRALAEPIPDELLHEPLPPDTREVHMDEMRRLLHVGVSRAREGVVLSYVAASDTGARQPPSPFAEEARVVLGQAWEDVEEALFGPDEALHATYTALRDELLTGVPKIGGRLAELRFDTDMDVTHGVVRYLELVKLSALLGRPAGQPLEDALIDVNARLLGAASAQQREVFLTSSLDDLVRDAEADARSRAAVLAARDEPSLEPFLPKRGDGLVLSASDIETYRTCPLKYKFARVFRIPTEPTLYQRFGIVVHQVLERFHQQDGKSREELQFLLDAAWRRGGLGESEEEKQLRGKATSALDRYQARFVSEDAEPVWLEKGFQFTLGPHVLRGRVDRVDRLPDGRYELIDYKTGRPRTKAQLREDVQLSLYAVAAREAWQLESSQEAYLYVLDDEKVQVPQEEIDAGWIQETVMEVADGILGQGFEPTPSISACSWCDYRIACPAAER